jgi:hypothetical protein
MEAPTLDRSRWRRARKSCRILFEGLCPPHRVQTCSHHLRSRATKGAQGEGRVGGGRPSTPVQRGQQEKHYIRLGHPEGYPGLVGSPFVDESDTKVPLDGF